jgi:hypothetical protein
VFMDFFLCKKIMFCMVCDSKKTRCIWNIQEHGMTRGTC